MNKTTTWVLIVVAFIVGGAVGFFVERTRATDKMEAYKTTIQSQMNQEKMMAQKAAAVPTAMMMENIVMAKKDAKLGSIAADTKGITLYVYDKDTAGQSTCSGTCATIWPPYLVTGSEGSNLPKDITTVKRADGSMQYALSDKPLYYYSKDKDSGDVYGDGIGGIWHVVKQ